MPGPTDTPRPPTLTRRVVAGLCLIAPFIALLWVSSYAKVGPHLWGIPFFYWYQMLWVALTAALTVVAYLLLRKERRSR